jgi:hypothetical protein
MNRQGFRQRDKPPPQMIQGDYPPLLWFFGGNSFFWFWKFKLSVILRHLEAELSMLRCLKQTNIFFNPRKIHFWRKPWPRMVHWIYRVVPDKELMEQAVFSLGMRMDSGIQPMSSIDVNYQEWQLEYWVVFVSYFTWSQPMMQPILLDQWWWRHVSGGWLARHIEAQIAPKLRLQDKQSVFQSHYLTQSQPLALAKGNTRSTL